MSYEPYERLVAPARVKSGIFRLIFGLLITIIIYAILLIIAGLLITVLMGNVWVQHLTIPSGVLSPSQTLTILGSFSFLIIAVGLVAMFLHEQTIIELLGGLAMTSSQFLSAMRGLLIYIVITIFFIFIFEEFDQQISVFLWLSLLPLTLLLILIQVSAEELLFRGYFQSQLAALGAPKIIWILVPSILFGLLHYNPATMGGFAQWTALWAVAFGILAADLTARSGTLGPAIAFHFTNNFIALAVFGLEDFLGGLSLYVYPFSVIDTAELITRLPSEALGILVAYLFVRLVMRT